MEFWAWSCAIDFQTESFLAQNKKQSELELSVLYLVPKHFRSESQLHMIQPFI